MKKAIVFGFCAAFAAVLVAAYSNKATAPAGTDNVAFGYGAGYQSSGGNENVICIGTDSGAFSGNNTDCIFIGNKAGKDFTGRTGDVVIGDVFVHTNGVTSIKGFRGLTFANDGYFGIFPDPIGSPGRGIEYDVDTGFSIDGVMLDSKWIEYDPHGEGSVTIGNRLDGEDHGAWTLTVGNRCRAGGFYATALGEDCCSSGDYSFSQGDMCAAVGKYSIALGHRAETYDEGYIHESKYAFCWAGDTNYLNSAAEPIYCSHGDGTFNINPSNGLEGFYVRDKNMRQHMRDEIAKPNAALKFTDEDTAAEYTIKFKAGQLCVFTNGVKIGTLTFTPVQ